MLSLDNCAELLSDFGLTVNQAKVYLAVVQLGIAQVSKISKAANIRREDVYRMLPKFEQIGLIEKLLGVPTKVRAIPVEDALIILIKHEEDEANRKLSELMVKKTEFLKQFKKNNKRIILEEKGAQFSLVSEKAAILSRFSVFLKNVQSELDVALSRQKVTQFIFTYADLLKKAIKRGVKIRIVTEMPEEEDQIPRIMEEQISPGDSVRLKYAESLPSHFVIADNKEMLVATSTDALLAERPALWTNSAPVIDPLQIAFEDLLHTSVDFASIKTETEAEKALRFVRRLRPSEHVIFVYETPEAKFSVLFNYIQYALQNGEAVLYVCSEANPRQIRNAMKNFGIDVEKHEKTGALRVLHYTEFYIIDGKFNISNTLRLWNKFYEEALAEGFKGLRATGETACFFKHNLVHDLVEYEQSLHVSLDIPMTAICCYRADSLNKIDNPINLYHELVHAHGTVLYRGIDNKLGKMEIRKA